MARFGTVPKEVPHVAAVGVMAPAMQRAVAAVQGAVERATGARPRVFETLRTDERQRFLYGFGREYDDGRGVVTHRATARDGWHFYGLAADLIHPTLHWGAPERWWDALGAASRLHGLTWGGDWQDFPDRPHVQWGRCRVAPSERARELYRHGGAIAVWREVHAL